MKGLHIQIRKCPNVHNATSHTSLSQSRERNFVMLSLHKYSHTETYCNIHILHLHLPFHTGEKEPLLRCVYIQKPFTLWPGLALCMAGRTPLNLDQSYIRHLTAPNASSVRFISRCRWCAVECEPCSTLLWSRAECGLHPCLYGQM